jgi:hypothetical protein
MERVAVDADDFETLARRALRAADATGYERALAAYPGELLPEDRYEDWCAARRSALADLHVQLRLGLARLLDERGAYDACAEQLRQVLRGDQTREDVHRRLIELLVRTGLREQAIRQFHSCRDALQRELGLAPQPETLALYRHLLTHPPATPPASPEPRFECRVSSPATVKPTAIRRLVGRRAELTQLHGHLTAASQRRGRLVVVCGEAGIGKTRLVTEFAGQARRRGATELSGGSAAHGRGLTRGAFAVALENYLSGRGERERAELARRCPALARCVPSLGAPPAPPIDPHVDDRAVVESAMVWVLSHISAKHTVCLVLGDLEGVDPAGLDLLQYLAHLALQRRWLIIGTVREEELRAASELKRMLDVAERERLCARVDLKRLTRTECDLLVRSVLPGGAVGSDVLHAVYERTLGNPLYVEEVLQDMREQTELTLSGARWHAAAACADRVPARVRALVQARVETLGDRGRDTLALAVASGCDSVTLAKLCQAAGALTPPISLPDLYDGLDDALRSGVLEARGEAYAFRHPLVRAALYDTLGQHRRKQLEMAYGRWPVKRQRLRLLAPVSVAGRDRDERLSPGGRERLGPGQAGIALEHTASTMRA